MGIRKFLTDVFSKVMDLVSDDIKLDSYHVSYDNAIEAYNDAIKAYDSTKQQHDAQSTPVEAGFDPNSADAKIVVEEAKLYLQYAGTELIYQHARKGEVYGTGIMGIIDTFDPFSKKGIGLIAKARDARDTAEENFANFNDQSEAEVKQGLGL
ncbi:MAG: hypothetical protein KAJ29_02860 [Alphaproteobacteria bacterium]|nr:hypothetical protein [Alphaproteobacteria bacterium]